MFFVAFIFCTTSKIYTVNIQLLEKFGTKEAWQMQ